MDLNALSAERRTKVLPFIQAWADSVAGMTGPQVFAAFSQFHATRVAAVRASADVDYVISPTAPMPAFDAELPSPTNDPLRPLEHIAFTVPWNMSEQPAASIPCGFTASGLPIGLQISGKRFDDLGVLQVSRAFELLRGPLRPWPAPPEN
jgi:aspartyl-tRNA(Asn)/glutamyl-tRNA(Gln) amidotransferase subunit A